jgi:hypothetical protein
MIGDEQELDESQKLVFINGTNVTDVCVSSSASDAYDPESGWVIIWIMGNATRTEKGIGYHYIHDGTAGFNPLKMKIWGHVRTFDMPKDIDKYIAAMRHGEIRVQVYDVKPSKPPA